MHCGGRLPAALARGVSASCYIDAPDGLHRIDDGNALMAAEVEQVPIARDDDLGAAGHGSGEDVIVIEHRQARRAVS